MAGSVTFSGIGSGIDFNVVRDAIISQRQRPITQLQSKVSSFNGRISALKEFNVSLAALTTATNNLTQRDLGAARSAQSADAGILTAAAANSASLGSFSVNVTRLATTLAEASRSYSAPSEQVLAAGAVEATFELRKGGSSSGVAITIDSSNDTLSGLRDAINAAKAGVTASIVDVNGDGTGHQLVLNSTDPGASGRVELIETSSTGTLADLDIRALNPSDRNYANLDAALTVNGLAITRSSNSFSDAVAGVTFNLKGVGSTQVSVTESTEIETKINEFITAYNAVQAFISGQYTKDSSDRPTGILAGDSTLRSIQQQLRAAANITSETNGGPLKSLAEIGVTSDKSGNLSFDAAFFNEKFRDAPDDVKALLYGKTSGDQGIFHQFNTVSKGLSDDISGTVQTAINGYQSSVKSMNSKISNRLEALERLRTSLSRQFAAADSAIGQLNGQGTALNNILKSLQNTRN